MKANFQEIIKKKTDKELDTISKDCVFYSEEERLIALKELEFRSGLSKETLNYKKDIESSLEIPTITEQALEAVKSTKKIYKERAIIVATGLGGPLVAGYLIAENFKVFNENSKAKKTWVYAIIGTIIIFGGALLIPDDVKFPNQIIPLLYTGIAYCFVEYFQSRNISAYIALGGKTFGWWRTIVVSLIGCAITVILIIVFIILPYNITSANAHTNTTRPSNEELPKQEIPNDKLVISNNLSNDEIDKILTGFCNIYNQESYQALPRLHKLNERQFAVTFPYDVEFVMFCFFVNYVHYPVGFNKSFEVTAWTTTKNGQTWITEKSANKRVMLFIPHDDTEYDNVYLTTDDNIGYKLGFAVGHENQLLSFPKLPFVKPQIEIEELSNKDYTDYK